MVYAFIYLLCDIYVICITIMIVTPLHTSESMHVYDLFPSTFTKIVHIYVAFYAKL